MSSAVGSMASGPATPAIFTRTFMFGIMASLSMILASWEKADRIRDSYFEDTKDGGDTYDFVIVGAGVAGSILANRLSVRFKVLLLEAGGDPHPFTAVPLLSNYLLNYAELDWRHVTMPQKQSFRGSVQSRASISQGRGLGGTSNLDYMMYLRGHPKDFENWAEITEDEGWTYSNLMEYFKSLESYIGPWKGDHHGEFGEMKLAQPAYKGLGKQFCEAVHQNGYPQVDLNNVFTEGCDVSTYPTKRGYRDSVYSSFLKPIKHRWNLVVAKYSHVNKVLIRGTDNFAHGVEYDRHGRTRTAFAKKEVILAAGAIQTPKLLMLSGIGPKSDLGSIGIPVVADLPVGKNLQDHLSVFLGPFFVDRGRSLNVDDVSTGDVLSLAQNSGPLTTTGFQAAALISSGLEKLHGFRNWPDLQLTMYGVSSQRSIAEDLHHAYRLKKSMLKTYLDHSIDHPSFSIVISGGRPKSVGTVKLLNRNPYAPLIINPNYFDKIYDVVVMVDGVKKALKFVENSTSLYKDMNARFTGHVLPGCEKYRYRSDAYFECYVRTMSVSFGNVAGTAPMGEVLTSRLQVKGIKGLRVMDASAMPSIVSTSTAGAVMVIAEKGADLLLTEWEGADSEVELAKNTNSNQIKESKEPVKSIGDPAKAILDALKSVVPQGIPKQAPLDLKELTSSMASLAKLLDPIMASASDNIYTGSFDLLNVGKGENKSFSPAVANPFAAMLSLAPKLKSQVGGLYQNYFTDEMDALTKSLSGDKDNDVLNDLKLALSQQGNADPLKIIQGILENTNWEVDTLDNVTLPTTTPKKVKPSETPKNMTLEDVFGIAEGHQEELEEYEADENNSSSTTTTPSPVKIITVKTVYSKPYYSSTTKSPSTTQKTTTTKKPSFDFTYEKLPIPLTKSKGHSSSGGSPVFPKPGGTPSEDLEPPPLPTHRPYRPTRPGLTLSSHKLKNLAALAQIQHETLSKFKNKPRSPFQPRPSPPLPFLQPDSSYKNTYVVPPRLPNNHQYTQAPPQITPYPKFPPQSNHGQNTYALSPQLPNNQFAQAPPQVPPYKNFPQNNQFPQAPPQVPPHNNFPQAPPQFPPHNNFASQSAHGRFPPAQQYYPNQQPLPAYGDMIKAVSVPIIPPNNFPPGHPLHNNRAPLPIPGGLLRPRFPVTTSTADPSDLKFAVNSIMNAKYNHPTVNPFSGIVNFLGGSSQKNANPDSGVLKALQLRANVEKYIHPHAMPQPISITHRPTLPPPTRPPTTHMPHAPFGPEELEQFQKEESGIFAPIKDALQPFTKLMKAPFEIFPNPFKSESDRPSLTSGLTKTLSSASDLASTITGGLTSTITGGLKSTLTGGLPGSSLAGGLASELASGLASGLASSLSGGLTDSFTGSLLPDIFQRRNGPMFTESAERRHSPSSYPRSSNVTSSVRNSLSAILPRIFLNYSRQYPGITPEIFVRALVNMTTELPKPFVLRPNKRFRSSTTPSPPPPPPPERQEQKTTKKLLDESVSDILSHLKNHHFANLASVSSTNKPIHSPSSFSTHSLSTSSVNSANEILKLDYNRVSTTAKAAVFTPTPNTKLNPPVEFHKSPWAKEPLMPLKNLHFKIKII